MSSNPYARYDDEHSHRWGSESHNTTPQETEYDNIEYDDDNEYEGSLDQSDFDPHMSNNALKSAYARRREASDRQGVSINYWITSGILIYSQLWYANILGVAAAGLGFYGAYKRKTEFVFVFLVLLLLEALKNVGVMAYYLRQSNCTLHCGLLTTFLFLEEIIFLPSSFYCGIQLYRTLRASQNEQLTRQYG